MQFVLLNARKIGYCTDKNQINLHTMTKEKKEARFDFRISVNLKRKLQEKAMEEKTTAAAIINELLINKFYN